MNPSDLKALIVVLLIAVAMFRLAKPIALQFTSPADFSRRRTIWLVLTGVAFVSPNLWLYLLVAVPLLWWAARKDTHPVALSMLMLHVIPPIPVIVPLVGNNGLFSIDNYEILLLCVLAPAAWRRRKTQDAGSRRGSSVLDILLLAYGVFVVFLYTAPDLPGHVYIPDSSTNMLRRAFLFLIDVYLVFWSVKRLSSKREALTDSLATFCLASVIMAATAAFETARGWLLYVDMISRWNGNVHAEFYLTAGSLLRAQASSGHPLSLGYLLAVAFAFWLYLQTRVASKLIRLAVTLILWIGLVASFSRGTWLGAALCFFAFSIVGPRPLSRATRAVGAACLLGIGAALSPLGAKILAAFNMGGGGGTVDPDLIYRERLWDRTWQIILAHPWFGDRFPWPQMADLRQGEGIIDLVNTYLGVALAYGLLGFALFAGFILLALGKAYARASEVARSDPDLALLGASIVAAIVGTLLMIANCSFGQGYAEMFYVLAGFAAAYAALPRDDAAAPDSGAILQN